MTGWGNFLKERKADRLSGKANVIVYFTDRLAELQKDFARLSALLFRWHVMD